METVISPVTGSRVPTVLADTARRQWGACRGGPRGRRPPTPEGRAVGGADHHPPRTGASGRASNLRRKRPQPVGTAHDREVIAGVEAAGTGHNRRRLRLPATRRWDHA